ncbi:hypothetical protein NU08_1576 [Flavobacterium anhuiense]|uniref:Uncharacterized protein n=1 Tax=Flavobacterium anhuiense TaxID=459526 RepID=A0A444W0R2_9FLAO|nr:hypothetical protein NU08_1576 [Flavobacterium anhuiense]
MWSSTSLRLTNYKLFEIKFVEIRVICGKKQSTKKIPNPNRKIGIWNFYIEN